ncbi:MAG: DcrB-related protein [Methylococcaceae bacterium]|nr:DcrB-related protein [Methylococcaceae bacterium]
MTQKPYLFNEGSLSFAQESFTDRTVNVLTLGLPETSAMNLTISRDQLQLGEDLAAYVARQIAMMEKQIIGYKLKRRWQNILGSGDLAVKGESIEATHKTSNNSLLYQWQSGFAFYDEKNPNRVLVFSVTQKKPFAPEFEDYWQNLLTSFQRNT